MKGVLRDFLAVKRHEWPLAISMFAYFFLVVTTFWILKPLKKKLFIGYYDASGWSFFENTLSASQAELVAKILNVVVAFLAVAVFTKLAQNLRRQHLTYVFCALFIGAFALYSIVLHQLSDAVVWSFYLFSDVYSTLMIGTFFAFLNDSVTPKAAKRLYGIIGVGGVLGGAFGSTIVRATIKSMQIETWMAVAIGITVAVAVAAFVAGRNIDVEAANDEPMPNANVWQGAKLVAASRYLLSIVAIVAIYEMVSTVLDFQFTATVAHYLDGPAIGEHFATVYAATNWFALFVQLFLASFIMQRFGVGAALMFLPIAALLGSIAFMATPILFVGSLLNVVDGGFFYSINQSAKEALYVPASRQEKYAAKAFIDMFIQRLAKAVAIGLTLLITTLATDFSTVRWLSAVTLFLLVFWIAIVRYVGRANRAKEKEVGLRVSIPELHNP